MGSNRSVLGLTLPSLVLAVTPSALVSAGATRADAYQQNVTDPWGRGRYGAVLDANNDGYPDIFYGTDSLRPDGLPSTDRFYINTGDGSFSDDPAMGLDLNVGSLCVHTVDYNSDGWPDLLVCGETGGLHLPAPHPAAHVHARTDTNGLFSEWRRAVGRGAAS